MAAAWFKSGGCGEDERTAVKVTPRWVDVDDLPRSPAIDDFFLQFNDLYEEMTAGDKKREKEAGTEQVDAADDDLESSQASYHESEFDAFIDHTPEDELEIFESENEKALRKAEKELKQQKKELRKCKLLDELRAEGKLKRRMLVLESSDEE
ncbi:hypothetical protein AAVH_10661 [Aphelenchoides avenae]|nr:hypothetical protein AAVH_10661 [Aphelenchus avenae]